MLGGVQVSPRCPPREVMLGRQGRDMTREPIGCTAGFTDDASRFKDAMFAED
jgi:hypothetical protein